MFMATNIFTTDLINKWAMSGERGDNVGAGEGRANLSLDVRPKAK